METLIKLARAIKRGYKDFFIFIAGVISYCTVHDVLGNPIIEVFIIILIFISMLIITKNK